MKDVKPYSKINKLYNTAKQPKQILDLTKVIVYSSEYINLLD